MVQRSEAPPADVHYSDENIELARAFADRIRPHWTPAAGHYVYDLHDRVDKSSPFQPGVYFVINYAYFITLLGGVDAFRDAMVWLPTLEQSVSMLRKFGGTSELWSHAGENGGCEPGALLTRAYQGLDKFLPLVD